ncbi:MAG: response regulator transcription factor, partial [Hassallia sp.]
MKILVVEDDQRTASMVSEVLRSHNYIVDTIAESQTALQLVRGFAYDLIILDIVLPGLDGISLCRQLRSSGYQMPILLLTVKDSSTDKVMGLDAGADDYMVKPFDVSELIARVRALLRRGSNILAPVLTWGKLQLDTSSSKVVYEGRLLRLTATEYRLLQLFLRNTQRIFSRSMILDRLWSIAEYPGEDAVTTHIKKLRQKLKAAGMTADLIETIYGLGYRLLPPPEQTPTPQSSLSSTDADRQQAE